MLRKFSRISRLLSSAVPISRLLSSAVPISPIPLPVAGWEAKDTRCKSGRSVGNALFDGNMRTVWDHYDPSVRQAMVSSLGFLKGKTPEGLPKPISTQGDFLLYYIDEVFDVARKSRLVPRMLHQSETVFHRSFDAVCPLPSLKGPASPQNIATAKVFAKKFGNLPVVPFIVRSEPLKTKSTNLESSVRREIDAPRLIHYDSMSVDEEYRNSIRNRSILLYDDVFTWGNTSEAARNILLLLGASEVDIITCFSTGDVFTSHCYKAKDQNDSLKNFTKDSFELATASTVPKQMTLWDSQRSLREWHDKMKTYIALRFPAFVPNDIPF